MFNSALLRQRDAKLQFEVMAHLIREFGAPPRPSVPTRLNTSPERARLSWRDLDTRSIFDWAEDHFGVIKMDCHMSDFDIELVPNSNEMSRDKTAATRRLEVLAAGHMPYRTAQNPTLFYEPEDCAVPGNFTAVIALKLANLRARNFVGEPPLTGLMQAMVTLSAAAYNRQGFVLANLTQHASTHLSSLHGIRAIPHRVVLNTLCFSTCLALRVRRQSIDDIFGTYGSYMTKSVRRRFDQANHQINMNMEVLGVLQMLCERDATPRQLQKRA